MQKRDGYIDSDKRDKDVDCDLYSPDDDRRIDSDKRADIEVFRV